ncbi:hypothetical protein [Nocardioides zeae]|uniref:Uncharacterized protein n=1 Tax=Nocardioides zeae TaxID=1457234 RepID=A0AAJ1X4A5_9ACTN|nr:hypothetical protein [Nocardioides zeae]MDQ1106629.1 hypothetical protein [Nocardioides zeae]
MRLVLAAATGLFFGIAWFPFMLSHDETVLSATVVSVVAGLFFAFSWYAFYPVLDRSLNRGARSSASRRRRRRR